LREQDGVRVVGEMFLPLGSDQTAAVVADIKRSGADAVVNTLNGGTNFHFFRELRAQKVTPAAVPTLSVSITENEVAGLNPAAMAGDYLAASYFQTVDRAESREFLRKLRDRYGARQVATDPMAAAFTAVHLWAHAVEKAGTTHPDAVRDAVRGMEFDGVRCRVRIDPENQHASLPARLGRVRADGLVDLVAEAGSETPLRAVPYPSTRKREEWDQLLKSLQLQWDGKWQPPEKK
jgi:urea transport system substrate-binding protein